MVFGENVAVLAGDALLTESFVVLAEAYPHLAGRLVTELGRAGGAGGRIGGQAYDIGVDGRVSDLSGLLTLHRLKTGALIRAAVRLGAMVGGASVRGRMPSPIAGAKAGNQEWLVWLGVEPR